MRKLIRVIILFVLSYSLLFAKSEIQEKRLKNFKTEYPGKLSVTWNEKTNAPKFVIGDNIRLETTVISNDNVHNKCAEFINKNREFLNLGSSTVKLISKKNINKKFLLTYQQYYGNIPVYNSILKGVCIILCKQSFNQSSSFSLQRV